MYWCAIGSGANAKVDLFSFFWLPAQVFIFVVGKGEITQSHSHPYQSHRHLSATIGGFA